MSDYRHASINFNGTAEDYPYWKEKFTSAIRYHGLNKTKQKILRKLKRETPANEYKEEEAEKEAIAMLEEQEEQKYDMLVLCLEKNVTQMFPQHKTNFNEFWEEIRTHFERTSVTNIHTVKRLLNTQKLDAKETVSDYVARINSYAEKLNAMQGEAVPERDLIYAFFEGLTSEYENICETLRLQEKIYHKLKQ